MPVQQQTTACSARPSATSRAATSGPGPVVALALGERTVRERLVAAAPRLLDDGLGDPGPLVGCDSDSHRGHRLESRPWSTPALDAPSFPRIADYAMLSDYHTAALVAPEARSSGSACPASTPPSIFGAVLDRGAGRFQLGPRETVPVARRYIPGTNVLETTWATATGWLLVHDALSVGPWRDRPDDPHTRPPPDLDAERVLIRVAECLQGEVDMNLLCPPAARLRPRRRRLDLADVRSAIAGGDGDADLLFTSDLNLAVEHQRLEARHRMVDEGASSARSPGVPSRSRPRSAEEALDRINATSSTGAAGSRPAASPTIRGGSTCSARR